MKEITKSTKTTSVKDIKRAWHLVDASEQMLGRVSNQISTLLQGKAKVMYAPYLDVGDYVVVINAKKVAISGKKADTKIYTNYSGYPGGLREMNYKMLMARNPTIIIKHAVSGMLPKNKLRDQRLTRLYVYPDENHPHADKVTRVK